jgi:hypothetical protein
VELADPTFGGSTRNAIAILTRSSHVIDAQRWTIGRTHYDARVMLELFTASEPAPIAQVWRRDTTDASVFVSRRTRGTRTGSRQQAGTLSGFLASGGLHFGRTHQVTPGAGGIQAPNTSNPIRKGKR